MSDLILPSVSYGIFKIDYPTLNQPTPSREIVGKISSKDGRIKEKKKKENLYYLQNFTYTCTLRLEAPFVLTTCNARAKRRNCKKMNKYRTLEL